MKKIIINGPKYKKKEKKVKYRLRRTVRRSTIQEKYVDGEKRKRVKTNTDTKRNNRGRRENVVDREPT